VAFADFRVVSWSKRPCMVVPPTPHLGRLAQDREPVLELFRSLEENTCGLPVGAGLVGRGHLAKPIISGSEPLPDFVKPRLYGYR
jgi:hypothetical protein